MSTSLPLGSSRQLRSTIHRRTSIEQPREGTVEKGLTSQPMQRSPQLQNHPCTWDTDYKRNFAKDWGRKRARGQGDR